jgi:hypothetical protein
MMMIKPIVIMAADNPKNAYLKNESFCWCLNLDSLFNGKIGPSLNKALKGFSYNL